MATWYVSATTSNGFVVGNDSNAGTSPQAPFLTISQAQTSGANGDTVYVNSGTYDLSTTGLSLTKNINWQAYVTDGTVIVTSSNATRTIALTPANNANTLTFNGFYVQNTGPAASPLTINDVAYDAVVVASNNTVDGGSTRHINDTYTRGTVTISGNTCTGTMGTTNVIQSSVTPSAAKKLTISGNTISVTSNNNSQVTGILVQRAALSSTSFWAYVASNTITMSAPSSVGTGAALYGIRCDRITTGTDTNGVATRLIVESNTITLTARSGTVNDTAGVVIPSTDSTAVAHNPIVRSNVVTWDAPVGRGISIGIDGTTTSYVDDAEVYGNTVTSTFYNGTNTPHNFSVGVVNRGRVYGNKSYGGAVGILVSINNGCVVSGNIVVGASYASLFAKGNTAAWFLGNTVIIRNDVSGARFGNYGAIGTAIQGATNNAATTFANNHVYNYSDSTMPWAVVDASQTATFKGNNYYAVGSVPANPWSYQGVTQANLAGWQGAQEATATSTDPGFSVAPGATYTTYDLKPLTSCRLAAQPVYSGNAPMTGYEFRQRQRNFPGIVGAYDVTAGDVATTRSARS